MKLRKTDHEWLIRSFPDLLHNAETNILVGELDFCADYHPASGKIRFGDEADRCSPYHLCDAFSVRIELDFALSNGWPRVREVGHRGLDIAERDGVDVMDLHFYSDTPNTCCLSIRSAPERHLTVEQFMTELVVPFFYRLSYTDRFGILAARRDLWGEYSHGVEGCREYEREIRGIARQKPGRNDACPCGSGRKYKRCHVDEVAQMRSVGSWRQTMGED